MNQQTPIPMSEESFFDETDADTITSVEDFIKELEAKEKDLHITSDMQIEVAESDVNIAVPDFVQDALTTPVTSGPVHPGSGSKTRVFELEQEVQRLEARIAELRTDRNDIQEKSDRRLKDFENFKYRVDRERRGAFIDQICNLASQMLPVLDNFDRALDASNKLNGDKSPEFQQFYDGIALVHEQINEVLAGMGVEPIKSVGEIFDPNFHEAVSAETRSDLPNNTIVGEMLCGYRIGNRVIRHSMVKVTSAPPSKAPAKPTRIELVDMDDPIPLPDPETDSSSTEEI